MKNWWVEIKTSGTVFDLPALEAQIKILQFAKNWMSIFTNSEIGFKKTTFLIQISEMTKYVSTQK